MDIHFEKNAVLFVWNDRKAAGNPRKHDGVTFEQATEPSSTRFLNGLMPDGMTKRVMR